MKSIIIFSFVAATSAYFSGGPCSNTTAPRVYTTKGFIEGLCLTNDPSPVHGFLSVPYAKPPIGDLRLEKPVESDRWTGIKETKVQPPRCAQSGTADPNSEDCLYLNVFAPADKLPLKPVVVIIPGGAYTGGGARQHGAIGIAKNLVSKEVVVVVLQYRLGIFGFGSTGDSAIPGNYGLFDIKMVLEWIQKNIIFFGGNPKSVTLNGGSAGAGAVDCLSISPSTYNLFHKAWAFSGSCRESYKAIVNNTYAKAQAAGLTWPSGAELKAKLKALVNITPALSGWSIIKEDSFGVITGEFGPIFDRDFFPVESKRVLRNVAPVKPRVHGCTFHEGAMMTGAITITNSTLDNLLNVIVPEGLVTNRSEIIDHLRAQYQERGAALEPNDPAFGERIIISSVKDVMDRLNELHGFSQKSYLYVFKYFTPTAYLALYPYVSYASHALEQNYMFAMGTYSYDSNDMIMVDMMTRAVSNFAKTGNPNKPMRLPINWQRNTLVNKDRQIVFDLQPQISDNFFNDRIRINNWLGKAAGYFPLP